MHKLISLILCLVAFLLISCAPDPWDQVVGSLNELETVMRQNVEDPDKLIVELDRLIETKQPELRDAHQRIINGSVSTGDRKLNANKQKLLDVIVRITDLDLEIQDRLRDDPQKLYAYMKRVNQLGVFESE